MIHHASLPNATTVALTRCNLHVHDDCVALRGGAARATSFCWWTNRPTTVGRAVTSRDQLPARVLIAGGAGGVGLACAEALARSGFELILCDIDGVALTRAQQRLNAFARFCDAIEENSVAIFAAEIAETFGSVDVLINASGRGYVRVLAMMRLARGFMPLLRRATGERLLINIAPAGGFVESDGMFPYAGSRVAFDGLSQALGEQVRGTAIKLVNITPKLSHGTTAERARRGPLYQLDRVDEEEAAGRIVSLIQESRPSHSVLERRSRRQS